ncbi:MAG: DUF423 domain-containing protein [Leptospiraceae bacterium]|nr:DUF423 domain-containing protein [Leptospiraceae bacterium]
MKLKNLMILSSIGGFLAITLGAFGAHGLKSHLSERELQIFETGVKYQFYHSLAILIVCIIARVFDIPKLVISAWIFIFGMILFSGSLYILVITHTRTWGMITPVGGTLFLVGWGNIIYQLFKWNEYEKD